MSYLKNFTNEEFWKSYTASVKGINNVPDNAVNLSAVCAYYPKVTLFVQCVRNVIARPVHIQSLYRCPKLNSAVGGVSNSFHRLGAAVDFKADMNIDALRYSVNTLIKDTSHNGNPLYKNVNESTWIHVQLTEYGKNLDLVTFFRQLDKFL